MAITFTKNLEEYTTTQRNAKVKHFMEFTSKKQLEEANILSDERLEFVKSFKGTFNFAIHEEGKYMAVTLYKANEEQKYKFLVLNLEELSGAPCDSIKNAKAEILALVEQETAEAMKKQEEADEEEADEELAKEA